MNVTERRRAVTNCCAPITHCQPGHPGKLQFAWKNAFTKNTGSVFTLPV